MSISAHARPGKLARYSAAAAAVAAFAVAAAGCGKQEITQARLERDFAATYANLTAVRRDLLGQRRVPTRVDVSCGRENPNVPDAGTGEWRCVARPLTPVGSPSSYEVEVLATACWKALLRGFRDTTVRDRNGRTVPDPLYGFDGCLSV